MKLEFITRTDEEIANCDYRDAFHIKINNKTVFRVSDGEPEDSNLSRDFNDIYDLPSIIENVYNAGINNEPLETINSKSSDI